MTDILEQAVRKKLTRDERLEALRSKYEHDLEISIEARGWYDHVIKTSDLGQREAAKALPLEQTNIGRSRLRVEKAAACESLSRAAYTNELYRGGAGGDMYVRIIVRAQRSDEGPMTESARIHAKKMREASKGLEEMFGIKISHTNRGRR